MKVGWTVLLLLVFAFIFLIPCILYSFDVFVVNVTVFSLPLMIVKKDSLKKEELFKNYDDDKSAASLSVNSVYINIDEKSTLETIKEDLKEVAGIYAIVHNETKKLYIGSSMNLAKRILEHIKNISSNIHLQRAISKYGLNNF